MKKLPGTQEQSEEVELQEFQRDEEEHEKIRVIAHLKAEKRGFEPGHEEADWLEAEKEYDESLAKN